MFDFPLNSKRFPGAVAHVDASRDPEVLQALAQNTPLPARDVVLGVTGLTLALPPGTGAPADFLSGGVQLALASFLNFETAAVNIGLPAGHTAADWFPGLAGNRRFAVLAGRAGAKARGSGSMPAGALYELSAEGSVSGRADFAILAALDAAAGAADHFAVLFSRLSRPADLQSSSELGGNTAIVFAAAGDIHASAAAALGIHFNWLRQIGGVLQGDLGLRLDTGVTASLTVSLAAALSVAVSPCEDGWLRLRVLRQNASGAEGGLRIAAGIQGATPVPSGPDELLRAILGLHPAQWIEDLLAGDLAAGLSGLTAEALAPLRARWAALELPAREFLARAAAVPAAWKPWRETIAQLAACANGAEAAAILRQAIVSGAASALWISWLESLCGTAVLEQIPTAVLDQAISLARAVNPVLTLAECTGILQTILDLAGRSLPTGGTLDANPLDSWLRSRLGAALGNSAAGSAIEALLVKRDAIYQKLLAALVRRYSLEASFRWQAAEQSTALLDASFRMSARGAELYRAAAGGDFRALLDSRDDAVRVRRALLTHGLRRETVVELHLPFLTAEEWVHSVESLAKAEFVDGPDGRVFAYTVQAEDRLSRKNHYQSVLSLAGKFFSRGVGGGFSLGYSDSRCVLPGKSSSRLPLVQVARAYGVEPGVEAALAGMPAADPVTCSLSLSLQGPALEAWLAAPAPGDPGYREAFTRVSVAAQRAMRRWLPYLYFSDPARLEDLLPAQALLVYAASEPFAGKGFSYDSQDPAALLLACQSGGNRLRSLLASARQRLLDAGKARLAAFYDPESAGPICGAVLRDRTLLRSLLLADSLFIGKLAETAKTAAKARAGLQSSPQSAIAELSRFAAQLADAFHAGLRRLYGGVEFIELGSLLLVEASAAWAGTGTAQPEIAATLEIEAAGKRMAFLNSEARRQLSLLPPAPSVAAPPQETSAPPAPAPAGGRGLATPPAATDPHSEALRIAAEIEAPLDAYTAAAVDLYNHLWRCRLLKQALTKEAEGILQLLH